MENNCPAIDSPCMSSIWFPGSQADIDKIENPIRWPKFLLNTMLSLDVQSSKLRYKFLYHIHNVLDKFSVSNIIDCAKTGRSPDNPHWVNSIKSTLSNTFILNWMDDSR